MSHLLLPVVPVVMSIGFSSSSVSESDPVDQDGVLGEGDGCCVLYLPGASSFPFLHLLWNILCHLPAALYREGLQGKLSAKQFNPSSRSAQFSQVQNFNGRLTSASPSQFVTTSKSITTLK